VLKAIQDILQASLKYCNFLRQIDAEALLENEDLPDQFKKIKENF